MDATNDYFGGLEMTGFVGKRRVYLSTDEPTVLDEARQKYPNYEFISNKEVAQNANVSTRYSDFSMIGLILDIFLLSRSDYIVCTLTSQVCRTAYELMQTLHADASRRFFSVDTAYYFNEVNYTRSVVVLPHHARFEYEADVDVGVLLETFPSANYTLGWTFVKVIPPDGNTTLLDGYYIPSFKIKPVYRTIGFPEYPDVKLSSRKWREDFLDHF
jgi:glycoprotein 6-alpha-L-fucosyltransferase